VVVKTTNEDDLIADLAQTFVNLRVYRWKLNAEKCVFSIPSGKLLGFMVSHRGIEANPAKVDAIRRINRPTGKKDVMMLIVMMAALGHFISKLGEKGLPFFKLLKKSDKFKWTDKADQVLKELKTFLTTPPVMVPPEPKEPLLLYISTSTQVVSTMLVVKRPEEGHQYPV
jgi:dsDNA-binding SOS-regulon protein